MIKVPLQQFWGGNAAFFFIIIFLKCLIMRVVKLSGAVKLVGEGLSM